MALLTKKLEWEKKMRSERLRLAALALALSSAVLLGGCDDSEGGVGASVGLPAAFSNGLNDPVDIGVGSVHMVGNPRW